MNRTFLVAAVGVGMFLSLVTEALAVCSREDVDHYLSKGFTADQVTKMCAAGRSETGGTNKGPVDDSRQKAVRVMKAACSAAIGYSKAQGNPIPSIQTDGLLASVNDETMVHISSSCAAERRAGECVRVAFRGATLEYRAIQKVRMVRRTGAVMYPVNFMRLYDGADKELGQLNWREDRPSIDEVIEALKTLSGNQIQVECGNWFGC